MRFLSTSIKDAPIVFDNAFPCFVVIGENPRSLNLDKMLSSSRKSDLVATRISLQSGLFNFISGSHWK